MASKADSNQSATCSVLVGVSCCGIIVEPCLLTDCGCTVEDQMKTACRKWKGPISLKSEQLECPPGYQPELLVKVMPPYQVTAMASAPAG